MAFDWTYLLFLAPGVILALWASWRVRRTFEEMSGVATWSGMSGAEVAEAMLRSTRVNGVRVEEHQGFLSDHYDPSERVVRLSPDVYHGRSISAVGVAAHECGHVLQHAEGYAPMRLRQGLVGPANLGSTLSYVLLALGVVLQFSGLVWAGIIAFSAVVLFQLVTLPVEFDASTRARRHLRAASVIGQDEEQHVARVLNAAALTYVAALVTSLLTLAYYILRLTGLGRSEE